MSEQLEAGSDSGRRRSWGRWGAIGLIPFLGVLALVWLATSLGPADEAQYALVPGGGVAITESAAGIEFAPTAGDPEYGVIFYPGARIDHQSYATLGRDFVEHEDALFVIAPMRFGMAILSVDKAAEVIAAHPEVDRWVLVGHSLGGVAACQFVQESPDAVETLVLLAGYPAESVDLADSVVTVVSVTADLDSVLDAEAFDAARERLPDDTTYVEIEGGNHAQFGSYGSQPGDGEPTISAEEQRAATIAAIVDVVDGGRGD